jgi:hydrogenase maturation protease
MKLAVIGIGQSLRGDDAAGIVAVRHWIESYPDTASRPDIITENIELPGLNLLDILGSVDGAIVVDAVRSSASAGSIHRLDQDRILAFGKGAGIAHGWGVAETLALARKLNLPASHTAIKLVGIEAAQVELGAGLSPEIEQAIPAACEAIEMEVQQFLR